MADLQGAAVIAVFGLLRYPILACTTNGRLGTFEGDGQAPSPGRINTQCSTGVKPRPKFLKGTVLEQIPKEVLYRWVRSPSVPPSAVAARQSDWTNRTLYVCIGQHSGRGDVLGAGYGSRCLGAYYPGKDFKQLDNVRWLTIVTGQVSWTPTITRYGRPAATSLLVQTSEAGSSPVCSYIGTVGWPYSSISPTVQTNNQCFAPVSDPNGETFQKMPSPHVDSGIYTITGGRFIN